MKFLTLIISVFPLIPTAGSALPALNAPTKQVVRFTDAEISQVTFNKDWLRYPSPDVMINRLRDLFPDAYADSANINCTLINETNVAKLGVNDPHSGKPASEQPNSAFLSWYLTCYANLASSNLTRIHNRITVDDYSRVIGRPAAEECAEIEIKLKEDNQLSPPDLYPANCKFMLLSKYARLAMLQHYVVKLIGPPEVLADLGISRDQKSLEDKILKEVESFAETPDGRYDFLFKKNGEDPQDIKRETLTADQAARIMGLLVSLEDGLRY